MLKLSLRFPKRFSLKLLSCSFSSLDWFLLTDIFLGFLIIWYRPYHMLSLGQFSRSSWRNWSFDRNLGITRSGMDGLHSLNSDGQRKGTVRILMGPHYLATETDHLFGESGRFFTLDYPMLRIYAQKWQENAPFVYVLVCYLFRYFLVPAGLARFSIWWVHSDPNIFISKIFEIFC